MQPSITEIESFFKTFDFDETPFPYNYRLSCNGLVFDLKKFVESHLEYLKNNKGRKIYLPYYKRLQEIYVYLKN